METIDPNEIPTPEAEATPEPIVAPQTRETELEEPLSDQLLAEARDPDAQMREANRRAENAESEASQLCWPPNAVEVETPTDRYQLAPIPLQWTPGRHGLYDALRSADGADSLPGVSLSRGMLDSRIILFLATHDAAEWRNRRVLEAREMEITLPPLCNDYPRFLAAIDKWADVYIPLSLEEAASEMARMLIAIHRATKHVVINHGGAVGKLGKL